MVCDYLMLLQSRILFVVGDIISCDDNRVECSCVYIYMIAFVFLGQDFLGMKLGECLVVVLHQVGCLLAVFTM